jgi:hypothetical protein
MPVTVFVSEIGYLPRNFRNRGEAIGYLSKMYGSNWKKRRVRFETTQNNKVFDGFSHEKCEFSGSFR